MRIAADTNLLVRAMTDDDPEQGRIARRELDEAQVVVLPQQALCETVWVLSQGYKIASTRIAAGLRDLLAAENVLVDRLAAEAGLVMLDVGGDFADGVIAHEGRRLGAETFVSFDRKAVRLLSAHGHAARMPA